MSDVVNYYEHIYNEEQRLNDSCDNRHKTERIVKTQLLTELAEKYNVKSIADIGAGTGLYSIYFAKNGFQVVAGDIVPKHIEIINEKSKKNNLNLKAFVCDAKNVPLEDNSFDMVLLAGPLYHLHSLDDKLKVLMEAKRICKPNGIIVADYLSDVHGFIQHILLDNSFIEKDIDYLKNDIDEVFSYDNYNKMVEFSKILNLMFLDVYGTDGITRFIQQDINKLNEKQLNEWIKFIKKNTNNKQIIDLSEHCLAVFKKES